MRVARMRQTIILLTLLFAAPASAGGFIKNQKRHPRYRQAAAARGPAVKVMFEVQQAAWPPRIYLRAYKLEGVLELWAAPRTGATWIKVHTFPICAASGVLGPKRAQGDWQVPEGFYFIDRFNPRSRFHLSLGINYPNAVDRSRRTGKPLGGDIFIHGDCVTIGCLPLQDGPMESLYVAAVAAKDAGQRRIPVHLFPCRFGQPRCEATLKEYAQFRPDLSVMWDNLRAGHDAFKRLGRPPRVQAQTDGTYTVRPL